MRLKLIAGTLLVVAALGHSAVSRAQSELPEIRTTLKNASQVIEALLIPPATMATKTRAVHREVKVLSSGEAGMEVKIETKPEDHAAGTLYTIFSRSESGRLSASPLRVLAEVAPAPQEFPTSCLGEARNRSKLESLSERSLQKLIEVRKKKKALLMERIRSTLTPQLVERLTSLESDLALHSGEPLSRTLSDEDLVQRILTLASAAPAKE